jgi:excisionase family DNA binding protein
MNDLLTTNDAAKVLGVAPDTVRLYERTGRLPAVKTVSGVRLFWRADVEVFKTERAKRLRRGAVPCQAGSI